MSSTPELSSIHPNLFPVRVDPGRPLVHPRSIQTTEQAKRFATLISFGKSVAGLLGEQQGCVEVTELQGADSVAGWELRWKFAKQYPFGTGFQFGIHVYVPFGQRPGRAAEKVFDAYRRFLEHELREGFLLAGDALFDPHHLDELEEAEEPEEPEEPEEELEEDLEEGEPGEITWSYPKNSSYTTRRRHHAWDPGSLVSLCGRWTDGPLDRDSTCRPAQPCSACDRKAQGELNG